jgi:hypothetical protein
MGELLHLDLRRDVDRELEHAHHGPRLAPHGRVVGLEPHVAPVAVEAFEAARLGPPGAQLVPETRVLHRLALAWRHEHAVMAPAQLVEAVAQRAQEVLVRLLDAAFGVEPDEGLHRVERSEGGQGLRRFGAVRGRPVARVVRARLHRTACAHVRPREDSPRVCVLCDVNGCSTDLLEWGRALFMTRAWPAWGEIRTVTPVRPCAAVGPRTFALALAGATRSSRRSGWRHDKIA